MKDRTGLRVSIFFIVKFSMLLLVVLYTYNSKQQALAIKTQTSLRNYRMIDSAMLLLQDGDIMLRTGKDMISTMLGSINKQDKTYSHCGIIAHKNGQPYIYHSIGGEDNPDQKLKYENVRDWLNTDNIDGFAIVRYGLNNVEQIKLDSVIKAYYAKPILFDMDFDLVSDDRFYCSEFVYKSILSVLGDSSLIKVDTLYERPFVGVDQLFLNTRAKFICRVKFK